MGSRPFPTVMENLDGALVYFVTKGPVAGYLSDGTEVWQVGAQVSVDDGKTVGTLVFTFETEEEAIDFKRKVNFKMEPTKLGEEEDE